MNEPRAQTSIDNRRDPRVDLSKQVTIRFEAGSIVGPGQNISLQGVFFTAPASIPVTVCIDGVDKVVQGQLAPVETRGEGSVGVPVRFLEPTPPQLGA